MKYPKENMGGSFDEHDPYMRKETTFTELLHDQTFVNNY